MNKREFAKLLIDLVSIQGDYKNENSIITYIKRYAQAVNGTKIKIETVGKTGKNIIITKTNNKVAFLPCIVAHLDTVFEYDSNYQIINKNGVLSTPENCTAGIGGDDRCGIAIALSLLTILDNIKIVFFHGEEVGCVGSNDIELSHFDNVRYIIEPDRRGDSDLILDYFSDQVCSDQFKSLLNISAPKFKPAPGTVTDCMILAERGVNVSVCNISCGYYNAHTSNEYIVMDIVYNTFKTVLNIIKNSMDIQYTHEYPIYSDSWYTVRSGSKYDLIELLEKHLYTLKNYNCDTMDIQYICDNIMQNIQTIGGVTI